MYKGDPCIQWDVEIGAIPHSDRGKEVTVNFWSQDIDNKDIFYTDSNGLQMEGRKLNFRPTWDFVPTSH